MQIPLKEFFKNRSKSNFIFSPDKTKIAFLDIHIDRRNIHVLDIKTNKVEVITTQQKRNINDFAWKNNGHLVYSQDNDGDENYNLFLVNLKTKEIINLTPGKELKIIDADPLNKLVYSKGKKEFQNKIVIFHNERDKSSFDKYLYDIKTQERELIKEYKPGEDEILFHPDTREEIFSSIRKPGGISIMKQGKEVKFVSSKDSFEIVGFTSNSFSELYVLSNEKRDKIALFKADLNLKIIGDAIFESNLVDIGGIKLNYLNHKLEYAAYHEEKRKVHYFDKDLEKKHQLWKEKFIAKFPNEKDSSIISNALLGTEEKIILFDTYSDRKLPDEYVWFIDQNKFIKLTEDNKYLTPDNLAKMEPISYKARDGLTIHGYLTMPKNAKGKVPIVVFPHGGPWVRDYWRYDPDVQFFANRGYGVLQPNFRISTGYGKMHYIKGWNQWGVDCQHDITDGTKWLIKKGYTEPGKIAIYGGSYGGYATLMGIVNEPDLYSAAIDYCGVSDLFTFWDGFPDYWKIPGNIFEEAMGNPYDDPEHFKTISPVYRAKEIKTPLMVVQGDKDPRVPTKQAEQIVNALKDNGVEVEYILKKDEGHGFSNQENKLELYQRIIDFLDKNLS